jgi:glutamyl-tRNA reductase
VKIFVVGASYRTTPIQIREHLHLTDETRQQAYQDLAWLDECVILATCNRFEIYGIAENIGQACQYIEDYLIRLSKNFLSSSHLYFYKEGEAATHLMRVGGGLESLILGEPQILGQLVTALDQATYHQKAGTILSRLFTMAIGLGKRARTETSISRHSLSLGQIAVQISQQHLGDLHARSVLIIGSGDMALQAAHAFRRTSSDLIFVNRTLSKAEHLAYQMKGQAVPWETLPDLLSEVDVVVTATSAPQAILSLQTFTAYPTKPVVYIDLGLPRNIESSIDLLPMVKRYDIDDLKGYAVQHLAQRQSAITAITQMITQEQQAFMQWLEARHVVAIINQLRHKAESIVQDEVEQALQHLVGLTESETEIIRRLGHRIINKMLHDPLTQIKTYAGNPHYTQPR